MKRISAIVPAFNEEARIGAVLTAITRHPLISETIVIDDGSTDNTSRIAERFPVTLLRNETNKGKGFSMERGTRAAHGEIFFFSDADISGLSEEIITKILAPVTNGTHDMSIGVLGRIIHTIPGTFRSLPVLGGERAVSRELWDSIPHSFKNRFEIETALNFFSRFHGKGFAYHPFPELSHEIKEAKHGILVGFLRRISMVIDVLAAHLRLYTMDLIKAATKRARAFQARRREARRRA